MAIDITSDPLEFDLTISGSNVSGLVLDAGIIPFTFTLRGNMIIQEIAPRNPDLDIVFDCFDKDREGIDDQGVFDFSENFGISGTWLNIRIEADTLAFSPSISGSYNSGIIINETLSFDFSISGDFYITSGDFPKLKWSKIGSLDFTIDHSNSAGERPMDWKGLIYDLIKFQDKVIIYGSKKIGLTFPKGNAWGYKELFPFGIKNKNAVVSFKDQIHWFVCENGFLWEFSEGFKKLGYQEFLSSMGTIVLNLDKVNHLIYLCDGTLGYVYSYKDKSFGKGPVNVTSYGIKNKTKYICASEAITIPTTEFVTNTYDFNSRRNKLIYSLELSSNTTKTVQVAVMHRDNSKEAFKTSSWYTVDDDGILKLPVPGTEFRFKFKVTDYESFILDYFRIKGIENSFSFLDEFTLTKIGKINDIIQLQDNIIVYGNNGIAMMNPSEAIWKFNKFYNIGSVGRGSQIGTNAQHWFISQENELYTIKPELNKLGYNEFLSVMTNPFMSLDEQNKFIYICDETYGYIYSYENNSMGKGPVNITGYGINNSNTYICATETINLSEISFTSNIYDFATRKEKTIFNLEVAAKTANDLQALIQYRMASTDSFTSTPWVTFTPQGIAYLPCYGREFKISFKSTTRTAFYLDYFKINGVIHGFSPLDTIRKER